MEENHKAIHRSNQHLGDEAFFRCAGVVLPYLNAAELASFSSSCKTLHRIAKSITSLRAADAARTFENVPIPFHNLIPGDSAPYSYFLYSPTQTLSVRPEFRQPWGSADDNRLCGVGGRVDRFQFRVDGGSGCNCSSCSDTGNYSCPCSVSTVTLECGPSCKCDSVCGNRVTQGKVSIKLKIIKGERKGWGLYAAQLIQNGQFVCEYAGELLSTIEARQRQQNYDNLRSKGRATTALLVVKEHLPSGNVCLRINIDATRIGNISRFINHSCDGGNLDIIIVRSSGALLPRICFFASRDIQENEELTFSYGGIRLNPSGHPCFCGSLSCAGILPSEDT